ncbi:hypothetical protein DD238_000501 [Peronospora effusa]|uniref:Uncharacterized protein n=1 Tax=Peronospora effusa TaxID=542832 RepID=A0A3M6VNF1_9STRA|nr:hypothetical protein DD238_000501 [Peronospora effusa]RQM17652.1 hypothetical protein DD237_000662 [Peronospora effusa]
MPSILLRSSAIARGFASSSVKRAKPIRVKKSEARRIVPEAPKPSNALMETPPLPPPATLFVQSKQQAPETFGGVMKESFLWGMGMAVAFSVVGIIFSRMEENELFKNQYGNSWFYLSQSTDLREFEESFVVPANGQHNEDQ